MGFHQANEQIVDTLPGEERGIPNVSDRGPSNAKHGLVILSLLLIVCAAGCAAYWKYQKNAATASQAVAQKDLQLTSAVPARSFSETRVPLVPAAAQARPETMPTMATSADAIAIAPALPVSDQGYPLLDKSSSTLMVAGATGATSSGTERKPSTKSDELGKDNGRMSELLSSTRTLARKADLLGNRNFILSKGSFINCALQTRLVSTAPGMTACVITRNIYSDNGKVLLVERGSTVAGEYQSNMRQGMARIFVLWTRIKTPNGVVINLDSPGTDQLGAAGLPGHVDNHFWQRFGGALLLSVIGDVAKGLTSSATKAGNNQFNFNNAGEATQNMATEALKNTINIPPTLYKNQGEQLGIYVARDLDFSSVYDVAAQ